MFLVVTGEVQYVQTAVKVLRWFPHNIMNHLNPSSDDESSIWSF